MVMIIRAITALCSTKRRIEPREPTPASMEQQARTEVWQFTISSGIFSFVASFRWYQCQTAVTCVAPSRALNPNKGIRICPEP